MTRLATSRDETPVFIPAGENQLFAVLTRPTTEPNGVCAILLLGGIFSLSITRNRLSVKLARKLAAQGYHVLRMDFHGVGESTGSFEESRLGKPWVGDLAAAVGWLREQGLSDLVLLGHCFGGRTCLAGAADIPSLRAIGLISVPVMDYNHFELAVRNRADLPATKFVRRAATKSVLRGIFRRRDRRRYLHIIRAKLGRVNTRQSDVQYQEASPSYMGFLSGLVSRRIPTLITFGTECLARDFDLARASKLGKLLRRGEPLMEVHRFDRMAHGFPIVAVQDEVAALIEEWLARVVLPGRASNERPRAEEVPDPAPSEA